MAIIQGNAKKSTAAGGFYPKTIEGSLRFNDDDSAYLSWTPDSAGNRKTWTLSLWTKRGRVDNANTELFGTASEGDKLAFSDSRIFWFNNGSASSYLSTTALFRDPSAWYHIVLAFDTTQATASNRVKLYVNGERIAFDNNTTFPSQNYDGDINNAEAQFIGMGHSGTGSSYDGYMAEVHFIDGQSDTASITSGSAVVTGLSDTSTLQIGLSVGGTGIASGAVITSIDSSTQITMSENATATNASATLAFTPLQDAFGELKNGVWVAKTPDVTYGTNGFYLDFQDDTEVEAFNTVLYRGNGGTQWITGMGFQPDLVWIKNRSRSGTNHRLTNSVIGADYNLLSNVTDAEKNDAEGIDSFESDGFKVTRGSYDDLNTSGDTYVAWGWKAGGSSNTYNVDGTGYATASAAGLDGGSVNPTGASINTTYGFSIVAFTDPNNSSKYTVEHGLGATPNWVIVKDRTNNSSNWLVSHSSLTNQSTYYLTFTTAAQDTYSEFWGDGHTSDYIGMKSGVGVLGGANCIAYCWAEKSGYSKFGSYSGSASTVTESLGFKPAFVMIKRTDSDPGDSYWLMFDNTRNVVGDKYTLYADLSAAESTDTTRTITFDETTQSFSVPASGTADRSLNITGGTYIYAAFADKREAAFWLDQSGNDNDWQPVNLDHNDTVADSPTDNFCTWNPLQQSSNLVLSDGNLVVNNSTTEANHRLCVATHGMTSGKYYWEIYVNNSANVDMVGIVGQNADMSTHIGGSGFAIGYSTSAGNYYKRIPSTDDGTAPPTGFPASGTIGVAFDADAKKIYFHLNGNYLNSADPVAGTGANGSYSGSETTFFPAISIYNNTGKWTANFGQQPFKYDPPA